MQPSEGSSLWGWSNMVLVCGREVVRFDPRIECRVFGRVDELLVLQMIFCKYCFSQLGFWSALNSRRFEIAFSNKSLVCLYSHSPGQGRACASEIRSAGGRVDIALWKLNSRLNGGPPPLPRQSCRSTCNRCQTLLQELAWGGGLSWHLNKFLNNSRSCGPCEVGPDHCASPLQLGVDPWGRVTA